MKANQNMRLGPLIVAVCASIASVATPGGAWGDPPATGRDEIVLKREMPYRPGCKACTLDLAYPKASADRPRPVVVVIHGGGWIEGDKSSFSSAEHPVPGNILDFARLGFAAATINYRMSGEAPYPAALEDCQCALRFLRAHAGEYQLDGNRIGAYGNSAGGHLALLLAMIHRAPGHDAQAPFDEQSSDVQAAASDSGPLDLLADHERGAIRVVIEKFMGGPPTGSRRADYQRASPTHFVAGPLPPLLLMYGEDDNQVGVNAADQFVAELSRAGHRDVTYFRLAGVGHCPHSLIRVPYMQTAVTEFFARTLAKPPVEAPAASKR